MGHGRGMSVGGEGGVDGRIPEAPEVRWKIGGAGGSTQP